jgi:predicted metalloprotease with PDZ domain
MLTRLTAIAVLVAASCAWAAAADEQHAPVSYVLSPVIERGVLRSVAIEMRFKGDADGQTVLKLPNEWGGESELWRGISDLKITGDGVRVAASPATDTRTITYTPGAEITVTYNAFQDRPGEPEAGPHNPYRNIVQPNYFHLLGNAIFLTPDWNDDSAATFAIRDLPSGWRFASDLEHAETGGHPLHLGDVVESVLVGGDFRIVTRPAMGGFLRVALRGTWSFTDDQLADKIAAIVASHNRFWRDPDEPFLVTLLPVKGTPAIQSLGGTGRGDAFALFATDNNRDNVINRIIAHEHIHTWIPGRIGRMHDKDEAQDYWLSEGFTDFYAYRLLVRDGIWSIEDFVEATNETLAAYWSSPVRNEPNSRIVADFWNDQYVGKLPYQRGFLLGFIFDRQLRRESDGKHDLDDIMLTMKNKFTKLGAEGTPPMLGDSFVETMRAAGVDPSKRIARNVEKGEVITLPADVFGPCGTVATLDLPEFTRGFDPERTAAAGNVVTGLDPDGPAYAAGMREGMKIIKRESGKPGDSRVELVYRVDDHGTERIIRYMPEGKNRVTLQEIQLKPNLNRDACTRRLGGL